MGEHMAITAQQWGITREDQDALALASHRNLAAAYERGFFDDLMTPYLGLTRDQNLRPDSSAEKLGSLKPVFGTGEDATMTAGNSTPLTDGASVVLLGSQDWAARARPDPTRLDGGRGDGRGRLRHGERGPAHGAGVCRAPPAGAPGPVAAGLRPLRDPRGLRGDGAHDPRGVGGRRLLPGPSGARAPLGAIDRSRLNVTGSSLAAGHPFAATGGRIVATLAKLLHEKGPGSRGLVSICAAGGQGVVAILEAA